MRDATVGYEEELGLVHPLELSGGYHYQAVFGEDKDKGKIW